MRILAFTAAGAFLAGAMGATGQTAAINDTNIAIILWAAQQQPNQVQAAVGSVTRGPAPAPGVDRRGISIGQQGFATAIGPQANQPAIAPQANEPAIAPQANEPMIGQQGSPAPIPSITNQAALGLGPAPLVGAQTNGMVLTPGQPGTLGVEQQGLGTVLAPQGPALGIGPQVGQPALSGQDVTPAMGPGDTRPAIAPRNGALRPGTAVGGATTPTGQSSGSGRK